jgi:hypothetical protein
MDFRLKKYYSIVLFLFIVVNVASVYFFVVYRKNINASKSVSKVKIEYSEVKERIREADIVAHEMQDSSLCVLADSLLYQYNLDSILDSKNISEDQLSEIKVKLEELKEKSLELDRALSAD